MRWPWAGRRSGSCARRVYETRARLDRLSENARAPSSDRHRRDTASSRIGCRLPRWHPHSPGTHPRDSRPGRWGSCPHSVRSTSPSSTYWRYVHRDGCERTIWGAEGRGPLRDATDGADRVTDREYQVVKELAQPDETMRSAAQRLGISDETGWEFVGRVYEKLGLPSRKFMRIEDVYALLRRRRKVSGRSI